MADLTRMTDGQRRGLQVGGVVCLVIGLGLFIMGPIATVLSIGMPTSDLDTFGYQAQSGFITFAIMGFLAFLFIAAGSTMMRFGFLKPVSEIVATETGGAVEHAGERAGAGLGRGWAQSGMVTAGAPTREVVKIKCRGCGYLESEDARFCSGCGQAV